MKHIDPNANLSRLLVKHAPDGSKIYYVYGLGLLYEVDEAENTKTFHYDQVGSTVVRTDDSGGVIGRAEYSAFGLLAYQQGDMETPFLYNGQWGVQSDANGLLNMRARYYSPYLMRFLNADPIGFSGGSNWFAYCDGNPISRKDPFGLWFGVDDAIFAGVGAAIGLGGKLIVNVVTSSEHHWQDYVGAAVGGAAGGETLLYTANPFAAGAVGGLTSNITTQSLNVVTGRQDSYDWTSMGIDTAVGAATGIIPGRPRIPGMNAGRGSDLQVFKQIVTKAGDKSISGITDRTAARMAKGAFYEYAVTQGSAASSFGSYTYSELKPLLINSSTVNK